MLVWYQLKVSKLHEKDNLKKENAILYTLTIHKIEVILLCILRYALVMHTFLFRVQIRYIKAQYRCTGVNRHSK